MATERESFFPASKSSPPLVPGDVLARKYRLRRLLGQGGMATVWVAENIALDTEVAIKVMRPSLASDPRLVARARQEARATAAIEHKNIVRVFDFGIAQDGAPFLVMELLKGETLGARLRSVGKLSPTEATRILLRAMKGITVAHAKGIIHRDLKPENIFLAIEDNGVERPKVLDFGVSLIMTEGAAMGGQGVTMVGALVGTPAYLPPEVLRTEQRADARTDIWALGVVLYEAIAGRSPFPGSDYQGVLRRVLEASPQPLHELSPGVSPELERILARALAKKPEDRFPSVRTFYDALAVWLSEQDDGSALSLAHLPSFNPEDDNAPTFVARSALEARPVSQEETEDTPTRVARASHRPLSQRRQAISITPVRTPAAAASHPPPPPLSQPESRWLRVAVIALGALSMLTTCLAVTFMLRARQAVALAAPPAEIPLQIVGVPPSATVTMNGMPAVLPVRMERGAAIRLQIDQPGYLSWKQEITAEGAVQLVYAPEPAPTVTSPSSSAAAASSVAVMPSAVASAQRTVAPKHGHTK